MDRLYFKGAWRALAAGVAAAFIGGQALAFEPKLTPPDVNQPVSSIGVNVANGSYSFHVLDVSIGQPQYGGLTYERTWLGSGWRDNVTGTINSDSATYTVSIGDRSERFTLSAGTFTSNQRMGSTLTYNSTTQIYTYTLSDGTTALFSKSYAGLRPTEASEGRIIQLSRPNGETLAFTYKSATVSGAVVARLQTVQTNLGYQLRFQYHNNVTPTTSGEISAWTDLDRVQSIDLGTLYCDPSTDSATCAGIPSGWPRADYGVPSDNPLAQTVTDTIGNRTRYTLNSNGRMVGIRRPGYSTDNVTILYGLDGRVSGVFQGGSGMSFSYQGPPPTLTTTILDSTSVSTTTTANTQTGLVISETDGAGQATSYIYDSYGRRTRVTRPMGDYVEVTYDDRGNVTQMTQVAQSSSGLSNIVTSASYDTGCSNQFSCNKPSSTTDALGRVTDYTYGSSHGGVTSVTLPAPDAEPGTVRPQTRYAYDQFYALYKDAAGNIVEAPTPVYRLILTSACATLASCTGGADEVKVVVGYGPTSGVKNHLLPVITTSGSGNDVLAAVNTATYDDVGNLEFVDGPLSGSTDRWRYRYDRDRRVNGVISPDPDGAGPLLPRATRITYSDDGLATLIERGTVPSQSNSDWVNFVTIYSQTQTWNAQARKVKDALVTGGSTQAVIQYSYDAVGRPDCTVTRMNPAVFGSLPASACTLGTTGADGPDRINDNTYDAAGRLWKVTSGAGTASARVEMTLSYNNNGMQTAVADAKNNLTTYEYDGFNRLKKIRYPSPTTPGTSSTTDYEQYTYDAASNVTQDRRRSGTTATLTYDRLNRTTKDLMSNYAYDNLNRPTRATASSLNTLYTWDALSRLVSESQLAGTTTYQYDLAGRRTRLTWPDSFYVTYDYLTTGEVTAIRENGAASGIGVLGTYAYDNLGRRVSLTRGNGVVTTYAFDDALRLEGLTNDLASTGSDQTLAFTHNAAGQILTRANSNSAYAPTMNTSARSYSVNGLNQYSAVSGTSLTYDTRGNLTNDGTTTYSYDTANRLYTAGAYSFLYDGAGRISRSENATTTNRYLYDGVDMIGEYSTGGTLRRRYVHGPAFDEPLTWYEGAGTTDRRWLVADERGSVEAITDATGAATTINTYDEYGAPGSSNTGRFQYTGQVRFEGLDVYHYKAREYHPALGRFMQTDPIGYDDGMNWYAYVGNDPIGRKDAFGLDAIVLNDHVWGDLFDHQAILIGNPGKGWILYSKDGSASWNKFSGPALVTIVHFPGEVSLDDVLMSDVIDRYDEAYLTESTPEQDAQMSKTAGAVATSDYHFIGCNCSTVVTQALRSAGILFPTALNPHETLGYMKDSPDWIYIPLHDDYNCCEGSVLTIPAPPPPPPPPAPTTPPDPSNDDDDDEKLLRGGFLGW